MHAHTDTHPGELQGKSGIRRNTLEKQEKTEGTRCKIVLNKTGRRKERATERGREGVMEGEGTEEVKQRREALIERSTCPNS